ncbi:MAG: hydroxymethylbilane synthase [Pirellulaceae bacterium]|nr:hydroxymethylbilane synthase [Pirellulaceae bacterium]
MPEQEGHPGPSLSAPSALATPGPSATRRLRLGTRASALARWQADWVAGELTKLGVTIEMIHVSTQGDVSARPLGAIGGQGVFTKELQRALLDDAIDLAVHSLKDLPTERVPGLRLAAVPERESTRDALICRAADSFEALPPGARIGTGSIRRRAQLLHARPDLEILEIRGNVDTRLRKLDEEQYDAIVLAEAGLRRLGLAPRITQILSPELMLSAVGQGALGIEAREGDAPALEILARLDDAPTHAAVLAERTLLSALRAGCLAPVGAWARVADGRLQLDAVVLSHDGRHRISVSRAGSWEEAELLGAQAAADLLGQGAEQLIVASRHPA